jgi:hypothetical protein
MDEWISRQHTLLIAAQDNQHRSDQHHLVENNAEITEYPINSYVLYTPPMGRSNKLLPKHRYNLGINPSINPSLMNMIIALCSLMDELID